VAMAAQTLGEIWESERFTFTTLSVALRAVRTLVAASSLPEAQNAGGSGRGQPRPDRVDGASIRLPPMEHRTGPDRSVTSRWLARRRVR
jgi:hypothetical protein